MFVEDLSAKKIITEGKSYICQSGYGRIIAKEEKELLEKICEKIGVLDGEITLKNLEFLIPYLNKIDKINVFDDGSISIRTNDFEVYEKLKGKVNVIVDGVILRGSVPKWYFDIITSILDKREIEEIKCDYEDGCYVKIDLSMNRELALQELRKRVSDDRVFAQIITNINGYMLKVCNERGCFVYHGSCRQRAGDLAEIFGGDYLSYYPETCNSNIKDLEKILKEKGIEVIPY